MSNIKQVLRLTLVTMMLVMLGMATGVGGPLSGSLAPQKVSAQAAGPGKDQPANTVDPNATLDAAVYPYPSINPPPISDHIEKVRLFDEYVVEDSSDPITEVEQAEITAMITASVRMIFRRQLSSGWLVWCQGSGSPRAGTGALDENGFTQRIEHTLVMRALLRYGVAPAEPRMSMAWAVHVQQLELVLNAWRKTKSADDLKQPYVPEFLAVSLQLLHDWQGRLPYQARSKQTKANPMGLSKESLQLRDDCVKALEALRHPGAGTIPGWRPSHSATASSSWVHTTATVLDGIRLAQLLGGSLASTDFLPILINRLLHVQQTDADGIPVTFHALEWGAKVSETPRSIDAFPRGWSHHPQVSEGRRAPGVVTSGNRTGSEIAHRVPTAAGVRALLLARTILKLAGKDPFKEVDRKSFDKAVWDGLAYLHRHQVVQSPSNQVGWPTILDNNPNFVWGDPLRMPHDALCATGNLNIAIGPWYRSMTKKMIEDRSTKGIEEVERIKSEHVKAGGQPHDKELIEKIKKFWHEVSHDESKWINFGGRFWQTQLLVLHGPATVPTTGPATTGKPEEPKPEKPKSGTPESREKEAEGKEPKEKEPDGKKADGNGKPKSEEGKDTPKASGESDGKGSDGKTSDSKAPAGKSSDGKAGEAKGADGGSPPKPPEPNGEQPKDPKRERDPMPPRKRDPMPPRKLSRYVEESTGYESRECSNARE